LRGTRGTYGTGLDLAARLAAVGRPGRCGTLRGRRGACSHQPSVCVAGVALLALAWIWWRAWSPLVAPLLILLPPGQPSGSADQQTSGSADQRS